MCAMDTDPYNKWLNLYNKDVESMWYIEHPQLRSAAMLLKALDHEFKRIYDITEEKIKLWENKFNLEKDNSLFNEDLSHEKENISCNKPEVESPDVFICTPKELYSTNNSDNEMITSPENNSSQTVSPKINRFRKLSKFKKLKKNNDSNYSLLEITQTPKVKLDIFKDVIDSTIINTTPETSIAFKGLKSHRNISKVTMKSKPKRELSNFSSRARNESGNDSDFTYCPTAHEITTTVSVNSQENVQKEKPRRLLVYKEPVVRGKERLKLEGWNCSDCEDFYNKLDLNTQDAKKMLNKCSKHRSKFKPQDFTPAEFWKLDFPPTQ